MPIKPPTYKRGRVPGGAQFAPAHRAKTAERGYDGRWQRYRLIYLAEHPVCKCGRLATLVDHVIPLAVGGAHCDDSNSQALCASCHGTKTAEDVRKYGSRLGRTLTKMCDHERGEGGIKSLPSTAA